jgi:hypothetical protein
MSFRFRAVSLAVAAAGSVLLLAGCASATPSPSSTGTPAHSKAPGIPIALDVAAHSVTQEGLAIALASNVLQTQLALVEFSDSGKSGACAALAGGGSSDRSALAAVSSSVTQLTVNTYYDAACAQKYMTQSATVTMGDSEGAAVTSTATYFGKSGTTLGTLSTTASASFDTALQLAGVGTFTTLQGGTKASLGLACQGTGSDTVLNCQGGIAQHFASLRRSLGSITPLTLTIGSDVSDPITFTGSGRTTASSAHSALTVTDPGGSLALAGAASQSTAAVTSGQAGGFVLFPATPTGWTVTDQPDDVVFTISVTDNTTRALAATVSQLSTKKVLATLALDQSGTGTITYLGQKPHPVTSWILSS